jgi:S-DNA-T family DNA segregation ATPase FtsK/SpoIIIE
LIKANFPTRISFAVTSQVDSRTILDSVGAEKLLGKGDMLYMPTDSDKPKRLQGCWVKDSEIEKLVYFWNSQQKDQKKPSLNIEDITVATGKKEDLSADALMEEARTLAREHGHISTSYLQRRLRIGYPRAARIMEQLEEEGIEREEEKEDRLN